ncbi:MAG TPA: hypothetical protein VGP23_11860 [Candidatus Binataceae bacterium]|nr:hypothetical protein [Candidatus Binataceae bacterium]
MAEPLEEAGPSGAAHCPQNLNWGGFSARHFAQILTSGAAQLPQNFMLAGLSTPHREQIIVGHRRGRSSSRDFDSCRLNKSSISRRGNNKIITRGARVTGSDTMRMVLN